MTQIAMAQINRKRWQAPLGIHSGAVAAEHRLYGYAMPEIMKPRPTPIRGTTQSDLPRQADERLPGIVMAHARAMAGYEKRLNCPAGFRRTNFPLRNGYCWAYC